MKVAKLAIVVALVGCFSAGTAWAQMNPGQASSVEPAAYGYATTQADTAAAPPAPIGSSPSDAAAEAMVSDTPMPDTPLSNYGSCGSCGGADCGACMDCCDLGEPLRIFGKHSSGIEAGGWISVGGHGNEFESTFNGPLGFNNLGNGVNLHQAWFFAGKEADTDGCGWDWGARVDYVFGVDAPDTQAFRGTQWDSTWNSGDYGSAIPQAYAEIAIDYLTIKAGYFYTSIGYEVVQAPQNFFYSHSYTQYYIEPFTHTGALATYDGFENWTFYGGWTAGWDTAFEQIGDSNMFLGGATYKPNDDVAVTYMTSVGKLDLLDAGPGDVYMHSIVMDMNLTDRLKWVIQSDLHHRDGRGGSVAAGGVNQYLFLELSDTVSIGGRFEWLHDRDGAFVTPGWAKGNFYNLTAGMNWKPHCNVVVRPEVRYDWFSGTHIQGGLPFDSGQNNEQLSVGFDVIFMF